MKSLFEKEEKEMALNQLKVDLISRFYPFSNDEIIQYKNVLNFDRYHLMENESVYWNIDLIEKLLDKIDWSAIWKLKNIKLDLPFFKIFESDIDFSSIYLSKNIVWDEELIEQYGDRFDWSKWLITKEPLSTIANVRKFKDKLDWSYVSRSINLSFTEDVIEEFKERWDWKKLSSNKYLPLSVEFIQKYIKELDFDELSKNPTCLPLIYKYPTSTRWNWDNVIINPSIIYNQESFDFIFSHYKKDYESKEHKPPIMKKMALPTFLFKIFFRQSNEFSFFLGEKHIKHLPWQNLSKYCRIKLDLEFINEHKEKLNFKETEFLRCHKDIISTDFILQNLNLFDSEHYCFYYLPLTIELIKTSINSINWNYLSGCEKLDWNWSFIEAHLDGFNLFKLSVNKGIYEKLMSKKLTSDDLLEML